MTIRKIEIFSAGCFVCQDTIELVSKIACSSCEIEVLDIHRPDIEKRAQALGIKSVPSIVVDGKLAPCCISRGPSEAELRAIGIGSGE